METIGKRMPDKITVINLGTGTHIFGAAHMHPNGDTTKQLVCVCSLQELGPKGSTKESVEFTFEQFRFYDDEALKRKVESREYAVLADGVDIRPDLARRDAAKVTRKQSPPTESEATVESSVLADILAEGDKQPTE